MRSREQEPYIQGLMIADRDAISAFYLDRGFRVAAVGIHPIFSADGQQVTLSVEISEGPQITVADIQVIGNTSVSASTILEEMTLKVGDPFGEEARLESQQRVNALGLFRRASVDEAPRLPGETKAHIIVTVEEAPARTISGGGGVDAGRLTRTTDDGSQEDYVAMSPRLFIAYQRRNLFGRNTSIDLFGRAALKPTSDPSNPARDGHGFGFVEYRTLAAYHERRFLGSSADLQISGQVEQGLRPTFNFKHASATAEALRKLRPRLLVSARYSLDYSKVFNARIPPDQQLLIDRLFSQVRLSLVSTSLVSDRRDDPVSPSHGTYATTDLEVAGRAIGSEIGYAKTFLQASIFQSLTKTRRFVFAGRAELGLAQGFARLATVTDANGQPVLGPDGNPLMVKVDDLPASQRFFAGGSTTVRGFQLDRLGVPEVLDDAGLSNGGNGLVIFNARGAHARGQALRPQLRRRGLHRLRQRLQERRGRRLEPSARHGRLRTALRLADRTDPHRLRLQVHARAVPQRIARARLGVPLQPRGGLLMRHRLAAAFAMLVALGVVVPAQTVLDKVLSNVNGEVITQLDVRQARMLKLRLVTAAAESDADVLRGLENRRLALAEVNHVTLPAPAAGDLAARRRDWESTVGAGASLPQLLDRAGLSESGLQSWLRDDVRIQLYLGQRFGGVPEGDRAGGNRALAGDAARTRRVVRRRIKLEVRSQKFEASE